MQRHAEAAAPALEESARGPVRTFVEALRLRPRELAQVQESRAPEPAVGLEGEGHHPARGLPVGVARAFGRLRLLVDGPVVGSRLSKARAAARHCVADGHVQVEAWHVWAANLQVQDGLFALRSER